MRIYDSRSCGCERIISIHRDYINDIVFDIINGDKITLQNVPQDSIPTLKVDLHIVMSISFRTRDILRWDMFIAT